MESHPCIVWARNDLRLHDNPALYAACATGRPVIVCYIWSEDEEEPFPGGASRAWLHDSLGAFSESLDKKLVLKRGKWLDVLQKLIQESSAQTVYWNRRYEPYYQSKDQEIHDTLVSNGIKVETFIGNVLFEPSHTGPSRDKTYLAFTSFYKSLKSHEIPQLVPTCTSINHYSGSVQSECLSGLSLLSKNPPLDIWQPGEKGAEVACATFLKRSLDSYAFDSIDGTSRLSAHVHFGELSVRQLAKCVQGNDSFYKELLLHDFAIHLLLYFPSTVTHPLNPEFESFPWRTDPEQLALWQEGHTGIPIVDAAMRELLATGWMPHCLRVIVGSFLVKQLLISWQHGEAWFWEKFFDADIATNTLGWQLISGFSADSASYFQIANPGLEGQKIDPEAKYIKHWLPELHDVEAACLHNPGSFHVKGYPNPIVDLDFARMRALEAYQEMKNG